MKFLAGDIGGTKVRLALYGEREGGLHRDKIETYPSEEFSGFSEVLETFNGSASGNIDSACFGIAGPVLNGGSHLTNLHWKVDKQEIRDALGTHSVGIVNDLVATAEAIPHLTEDQIEVLHPGEPAFGGPRRYAVLAPGTGLGQASLLVQNGRSYAEPSEGGHVDFAPRTGIEFELLDYLKGKFDRVSYERVLSGPGLENIYDFLKDKKYGVEPPELARRMENEDDRSVVISSAGKAGEFELCEQALNLFATILAAQSGNLALTYLATGGVFLAGGIAPAIRDRLRQEAALEAYIDKKRLSRVVERIPWCVITDETAPLLGAASLASKLPTLQK